MFVRLEAEGYVPWVSPEIPLGRSDATLDAEMTPGEGPSGVVLQPNGVPAAGAALGIATRLNKLHQKYRNRYAVFQTGRIQRPGAETDKDGRFQLPAELGDYDVCVWQDRVGTAIARRDDLMRQPNIRLQPFARFEAIVPDGTVAGGSKVRTSLVLESAANAPDRNGRFVERTFSESVSSSGVVTWNWLPSGVYALRRCSTDTTDTPPAVNSWRYKKTVVVGPGDKLMLDLRDQSLWESEAKAPNVP
jgi:hypothetical protein